ncbi:MAG: hypothetical protein ACMG6H_12935, partial [Acidobacteriota bacterium]
MDTKKRAMPPTNVSDTAKSAKCTVFCQRTATRKLIYDSLPRKGEPTIGAVAAPIVVTAVALETLVIALQEAITIGLLVLVAIAIPSIAAVVSMPVSVKVRSLWVVALP